MKEKFQKLIKTLLYYLKRWREDFLCVLARFFRKPLNILNEKQTIDYIVDRECSVARFGDGELNMMAHGQDIGFQKSSEALRNELKSVIKEKNESILICLPNRLNIRRGVELERLSKWWQYCIKHFLHDWLKMIPSKHLYGDTNISRLTGEDLFGTKEAQALYTARIWEDKNVILIEGEGTRFGVGNRLLENAKSVKRILGPAKNAFNKREKIYEQAICLSKEVENPLFLLALGPTATLLAHDLWRNGFRAIDIGHLDLSFEKATRNDTIQSRYDNEVEGGDVYCPCEDKDYLEQIVVRIE